jgi:hypothetical protein
MGDVGPVESTDDVSSEIWQCAVDQRRMESLPGEPDVRRCPVCGHRSDEPGAGVLADGFDVAPEHWGLRGDPHAWWAMRELLATTPTPSDGHAVRAAYATSFREVTGLDLDGTDEEYVYVAHLDHGGMSGGGVDMRWWRNRGIPLLVARAVERRPVTEPTGGAATGVKSVVAGVLTWLVVLTIALTPIGAGAMVLFQRVSGDRVEVTVTECERSGGMVGGVSTARIDCTATWTRGEQVVVGPFTGGLGESDVGKTLEATVRDGTAYSASSTSLVLPIVLIGLGLLVLAFPALALRDHHRRRRADRDARPR